MFAWHPPVEIVAEVVVYNPSGKQQISNAYAKLTITEADRENIEYIVTTLGENGKLALGMRYRSKLEERGEAVGHVHPLKFFAVIFNPGKPYLKEMMAKVEDDRIKWNAFMEKFRISLTRLMEEGKLATLIDGFAAEVGHTTADLTPFFQSMDWDGLVRYLTFN